jgi:hypothetical protein
MTEFQSGWRFCSKCANMTFNNFSTPGACQGGGDHHAHGFLFSLPFGRPPGATNESGFFFCSKCHSLFQEHDFGAGNDLGRCPKGGQHDRTDSIEFVLTHDAPVPDGQDNWRVCVNCNAMFFGQQQGQCPAVGTIGHDVGQGEIPDFNLPHSTNPQDWAN